MEVLKTDDYAGSETLHMLRPEEHARDELQMVLVVPDPVFALVTGMLPGDRDSQSMTPVPFYHRGEYKADHLVHIVSPAHSKTVTFRWWAKIVSKAHRQIIENIDKHNLCLQIETSPDEKKLYGDTVVYNTGPLLTKIDGGRDYADDICAAVAVEWQCGDFCKLRFANYGLLITMSTDTDSNQECADASSWITFDDTHGVFKDEHVVGIVYMLIHHDSRIEISPTEGITADEDARAIVLPCRAKHRIIGAVMRFWLIMEDVDVKSKVNGDAKMADAVRHAARFAHQPRAHLADHMVDLAGLYIQETYKGATLVIPTHGQYTGGDNEVVDENDMQTTRALRHAGCAVSLGVCHTNPNYNGAMVLRGHGHENGVLLAPIPFSWDETRHSEFDDSLRAVSVFVVRVCGPRDKKQLRTHWDRVARACRIAWDSTDAKTTRQPDLRETALEKLMAFARTVVDDAVAVEQSAARRRAT